MRHKPVPVIRSEQPAQTRLERLAVEPAARMRPPETLLDGNVRKIIAA